MGGEKRVNHGDERTRARALGVHPARQVVLLLCFFFVFSSTRYHSGVTMGSVRS